MSSVFPPGLSRNASVHSGVPLADQAPHNQRINGITRVAGQFVDLDAKAIRPAELCLEHGRIADITSPDASLDADAPFLLPGFVDAHVHVESSMLTPSRFAAAAVVHGTVATVSDPHEIANVLGDKGVRFMLEDAAAVPFKFCFGAPSCVPATAFETAGAALGVDEVTALLDDPRIGYLAEVMNYPGVLAGDPGLLAMIAAAQRRDKPVDGHAPGLRGDDARRYFAAGITTDHECFTLEEALDKLDASDAVRILIREGSAARNFDALFPLIDRFPGRVMLCSDDKHPDALVFGHINALCAEAVRRGADVFNVLNAACRVPVEHYGLDVGRLHIGDPADFVEVEDLVSFGVRRTWIDGHVVAGGGKTHIQLPDLTPINRFVARPIHADQLRVDCPDPHRLARVIVARDGQLVTEEEQHTPAARNSSVVSDVTRDMLKLVVVNRYHAEAPPAVALVRGFGLRRGAIAGSVAHDSHNLLAVGGDDASLVAAINAVIEARGGLAVHDPRTNATDVLPLPVAGLMSDRPIAEVAAHYERLDAAAKAMGTTLRAPFMTLGFMALLVIPSLKLSDHGLFDGDRFEPVSLWV